MWYVRGKEICVQDIDGETRTPRDHLEDLGIDGRIMLNKSSRNIMENLHWKDLSQDNENWRAFINSVINFSVP
jgi:hypothetical protein